MSDIIDINDRKKKPKDSTILFPIMTVKDTTVDEDAVYVNNKSCHNCAHYRKSTVSVCGHFPRADFHAVTTSTCTPWLGRVLWDKKPGLLTRIKNYLF